MPESPDPAMQSLASTANASSTACEFEGHLWTPAGGGLEICIRCEAEQWAGDLTDEEYDESDGHA